MKKIMMVIAAAFIFAAPAAMAQKINAESFQSDLVKSDKDIANPKKSAKASTWINRGDIFVEAQQAPTKSLFVGMEASMLKLADGNPSQTKKVDIKGASYQAFVYPYYTAYIQDGKVVAWDVTRTVFDDSIEKAIECYAKAYEIDPSSASKIKESLETVVNYCAQIGDVANTLSMYVDGAEAYVAAYEAQKMPAYGVINPALLYYAGYMYTIDGSENPASYPIAAETLEAAIEAGYPQTEVDNADIADADKGNIFYYLYHCYIAQKEADQANVVKAKDALLMGVETFPKNQRIIDALTQLYTTEEGIGDPQDLIGMIDEAIKAEPTNPDMWYARGRVFFAMKDYDECISSFNEVVKLAPNSFDGYFFLGLFYVYKGDDMNEVLATNTYTDRSIYDADLKAVNDVYAEAIPVLEKAHELKPDDASTVEYLKSICFRLRDEEGIMEKYTVYNELFKQMQE